MMNAQGAYVQHVLKEMKGGAMRKGSVQLVEKHPACIALSVSKKTSLILNILRPKEKKTRWKHKHWTMLKKWKASC